MVSLWQSSAVSMLARRPELLVAPGPRAVPSARRRRRAEEDDDDGEGEGDDDGEDGGDEADKADASHPKGDSEDADDVDDAVDDKDEDEDDDGEEEDDDEDEDEDDDEEEEDEDAGDDEDDGEGEEEDEDEDEDAYDDDITQGSEGEGEGEGDDDDNDDDEDEANDDDEALLVPTDDSDSDVDDDDNDDTKDGKRGARNNNIDDDDDDIDGGETGAAGGDARDNDNGVAHDDDDDDDYSRGGGGGAAAARRRRRAAAAAAPSWDFTRRSAAFRRRATLPERQEREDLERLKVQVEQARQEVMRARFSQHIAEVLSMDETIARADCIVLDAKSQISTDARHQSMNILTMFELAAVLSTRTAQLSAGAPTFLPGYPFIYPIDYHLVAQKELRMRRLPFIIKRRINDGVFEYFHLRDMLVLEELEVDVIDFDSILLAVGGSPPTPPQAVDRA